MVGPRSWLIGFAYGEPTEVVGSSASPSLDGARRQKNLPIDRAKLLRGERPVIAAAQPREDLVLPTEIDSPTACLLLDRSDGASQPQPMIQEPQEPGIEAVDGAPQRLKTR